MAHEYDIDIGVGSAAAAGCCCDVVGGIGGVELRAYEVNGGCDLFDVAVDAEYAP